MAWGFWNKIQKGFQKVGQVLGNGIKKVANFFKPILKPVGNVVKAVIPGSGAVVDAVSDGVEWAADHLGGKSKSSSGSGHG